MKLQKLRVSGLRSFTKETEIDLGRLGEQGLFAIFGPTGAGKSTILDGIFLALFGRCPRGEPSECVSAGALDLAVRLELSLDRDEAPRVVAVERRFHWSKKRSAGAGASGADLRGQPKHPPLRLEERKNDAWEPIDPGGKKPEEYLDEQIVRVSFSDFQQAVVLPQGEFDALLRARPADRRNLVASLFRTEHLGKPLVDALKVREERVRGEMGRLDEAVREVSVTMEEATAAAALAEDARIDAEKKAQAVASAERTAVDLRLARERCAARDAAAAALAEIERQRATRDPDRKRADLGKRAAGAEVALAEIERCDAAGQAADLRAMTAGQAAYEAEAQLRKASRALAEATAARSRGQPEVLAQLGVAKQAFKQSEALARLEGDRAAAEQALRTATEAARAARLVEEEAEAKLRAALAEAQATAERLAGVRIGEDERAEALAVVALGELRGAVARERSVVERERIAAEGRARAVGEARVVAIGKARAAEAQAERSRADRVRIEADLEVAAREAEGAERAFDEARRAAAAAQIAADLRDGDPCPVCGARDHPAKMETTDALGALEIRGRAREAAKQRERAADRALSEVIRAVGTQDEEVRSLAAKVAAIDADLAREEATVKRLASGEEVSSALAEVRADVTRLRTRADLALSTLSAEAGDRARATAATSDLAAAEATVAAQNRRAREAEEIARRLAGIQARADVARRDAIARGEDRARRDRARMEAEASLSTIASIAGARRDEIRALLAELEPRGQHGLFERQDRPRTAEQWIATLEARSAALTEGEDRARTALDEARTAADRAALEAREASARRDEAAAQLARAREAVRTAVAKAGFENLDALRRAHIDPASLAQLIAEIDGLDQEHVRIAAVLAERRRDVSVEVREEEAIAAERARDEARRAVREANERAAQAIAHRDELRRRRNRAVEIQAKIALLEPRAKRLIQIRQVVSGNQLSELAAERHLEAVTEGAAAILGSLSNDRYALVRNPEGAFAVADRAYGGLVRSPSTLSGGETFLVSLSLALSLSERIQLAGRTRFDYFFLDEGFGSLDLATLEVALNALERLRGPHRVIGMISHVGAIEERMPRKLRVLPARLGGSAEVRHLP